jgi:mevalonate kinase
MTRSAFAPGKIILSGEYAVVFGYPGLAIPSSIGLKAAFQEDVLSTGLSVDLPKLDDRWKIYISQIVAECAMHKKDAIRGRLTLEGKLPLGKGMGSSTAAVIAITKTLLGDDSLEVARKIEDTVNPGNSGLDFAVIWSEEPTVFKKGDAPVRADLPKDFLAHSHLIDTGAPNETTAELVAWIKGKKDTAAAIEIIGNCTERLLKGENLKTVMRDHHHAQCMLGVVPKSAQKVIAEIEAKGGSAKVIGAGARTGGSGMVLAID